MGVAGTAIARTLKDETFPIVSTTLGLALGFSVFALSSFPPVVHFGFLSAFVMVLALIAVFLVLPSLLSTVRLITLYDVLSLQLHQNVLDSCPLFEGMSRSQVKKLVLISEFGYPTNEGVFGNGLGEDAQRDAIAAEFRAFDEAHVCGATIWC